jgi:L-malate glycosyltransferase
MKIFYFIDSLTVGGSEAQMTEVVFRLRGRGHDVTVGCMRATGRYLEVLKAEDVPVVEFNVRGKLASVYGLYKIFALARFLRREQFEVIHTQDLWSNMMGVLAGRLAGTRRVISVRYDLASLSWYTPLRRRILRSIQNLSTVVVANSKGVRRFLLEQEGFHPSLIRVIYNGVDLSTAVGERKNLLPIAAPDDILLAVTANMRYEFKGHRFLIDAAAPLVKSWPHLRFLLLGEGELRPKLEEQVASAGLDGHVHFLGARSDVREILSICDLAVLPSLTEGLPNAVLEYMAAGLPTVATTVGGIPELIEHEHTGLLIPPGDTDALVEALTRLLSDRQLGNRLGKNAKAEVQNRFSYERLMGELEGLYLLGAAWHPASIASTSGVKEATIDDTRNVLN